MLPINFRFCPEQFIVFNKLSPPNFLIAPISEPKIDTMKSFLVSPSASYLSVTNIQPGNVGTSVQSCELARGQGDDQQSPSGAFSRATGGAKEDSKGPVMATGSTLE